MWEIDGDNAGLQTNFSFSHGPNVPIRLGSNHTAVCAWLRVRQSWSVYASMLPDLPDIFSRTASPGPRDPGNFIMTAADATR